MWSDLYYQIGHHSEYKPSHPQPFWYLRTSWNIRGFMSSQTSLPFNATPWYGIFLDTSRYISLLSTNGNNFFFFFKKKFYTGVWEYPCFLVGSIVSKYSDQQVNSLSKSSLSALWRFKGPKSFSLLSTPTKSWIRPQFGVPDMENSVDLKWTARINWEWLWNVLKSELSLTAKFDYL